MIMVNIVLHNFLMTIIATLSNALRMTSVCCSKISVDIPHLVISSFIWIKVLLALSMRLRQHQYKLVWYLCMSVYLCLSFMCVYPSNYHCVFFSRLTSRAPCDSCLLVFIYFVCVVVFVFVLVVTTSC